jgi:hypothetical protein
MPLVSLLVPRADVQRDESLRRIMARFDKDKSAVADVIALARRLGDNLEITVQSTSTST